MKTTNVFVGNIMRVSIIDYDGTNQIHRFNGKLYLEKRILYKKEEQFIDLETGTIYYKLGTLKETEQHNWLYVDEGSLINMNSIFPSNQEKSYFKSSIVKKYHTMQKI